ncbi:uncharacterized protein N7443_000858 [Penicillium atrosanguineum]|uniref:Isochorismatase-like domain-containing protein n=1 Tax=Penicillium atrosanguineum TaxID=1132637 RepID=A0A9W9UCN5_9EURO|nr:uncharacterized protein N7443_000858 [Penicillium atrosanguineum]KAJ5147548.1 hypothetical protein N7526_000900 [Penicillium atrosanguineum]KAJ5313974.1 hypothetical protein N7443_000858 [Penicillium atrosanguineum]KAJ5331143.1 hypothetical protein N7476_000926 [Penicillium atrosanguineum]
MASQRALFVIDIQNELIRDPETRIANPERITQASEEILKVARSILDLNSSGTSRASPALLVFVQHEESPPEGTMLRGSKPWELFFPPRESRDDEILVAKTTRDTFASNPDLAARLRNKGISELVVLGLQSECCVEATCMGALAAGFGVTLLSGAHSTYDSDEKKAVQIEREVQLRLSTRGARIVPWEKEISTWA